MPLSLAYCQANNRHVAKLITGCSTALIYQFRCQNAVQISASFMAFLNIVPHYQSVVMYRGITLYKHPFLISSLFSIFIHIFSDFSSDFLSDFSSEKYACAPPVKSLLKKYLKIKYSIYSLMLFHFIMREYIIVTIRSNKFALLNMWIIDFISAAASYLQHDAHLCLQWDIGISAMRRLLLHDCWFDCQHYYLHVCGGAIVDKIIDMFAAAQSLIRSSTWL